MGTKYTNLLMVTGQNRKPFKKIGTNHTGSNLMGTNHTVMDGKCAILLF